MRRLLVRTYPQAWRQRYGDELLALLEELPVGPATVLDLLRGSATAHWQKAHTWAGQVRRATPRQVLWWLISAGGVTAVTVAIFAPELVTSKVVPRQVHAAVVLLTALYLVTRVLGDVPGQAGRSRRTRITGLVVTAAWWSYMAVWLPGPTPWLGRSVYGLFAIGWAAYLVREVIREVRKVPG